MTSEQTRDVMSLLDIITAPLAANDLANVAAALASAPTEHLAPALERLDSHQRAITYRLLPKDRALEVFEELSPGLQGDLIQALRDAEVAAIFAGLDPDDRVWLLDELPSSVAPRLMRGLPARERELTAEVLGYPHGSIGRRMSPEYVSAYADQTVDDAMGRVRARLDDAETVYTLPVLDAGRKVVGVVSLRDLLRADPSAQVRDLMREAQTAAADDDVEIAARRCADQGLLALPIVDHEARLVGILTIDDAVRILEQEESEDTARQGGVEPLRRPYLSTPVSAIIRSRVVWLLVLAVSAILTVQVLSTFEATIEQVTVLALFVTLLVGVGGNTGNQAATTVTRALALGDVRPRDIVHVLTREARVGFSLGALLGTMGVVLAGLVYGFQIGLVVGLTLLAICTLAATVGGVMPLVARTIRVDPAVFSNPFITTFVDATGLIVYFLIARAILQI
ncbi:MAG: magnesium transporter [Micrococcales bacterium]|nr:magnesium transporter [Micrococcales bacterium]